VDHPVFVHPEVAPLAFGDSLHFAHRDHCAPVDHPVFVHPEVTPLAFGDSLHFAHNGNALHTEAALNTEFLHLTLQPLEPDVNEPAELEHSVHDDPPSLVLLPVGQPSKLWLDFCASPMGISTRRQQG
jgi:hypothetical protein